MESGGECPGQSSEVRDHGQWWSDMARTLNLGPELYLRDKESTRWGGSGGLAWLDPGQGIFGFQLILYCFYSPI